MALPFDSIPKNFLNVLITTTHIGISVLKSILLFVQVSEWQTCVNYRAGLLIAKVYTHPVRKNGPIKKCTEMP